jgi:hypothetical protein
MIVVAGPRYSRAIYHDHETAGPGSGTAAHAIDQEFRRQSVSDAELSQDFGIHRVRE